MHAHDARLWFMAWDVSIVPSTAGEGGGEGEMHLLLLADVNWQMQHQQQGSPHLTLALLLTWLRSFSAAARPATNRAGWAMTVLSSSDWGPAGYRQ
jgi:hypothetical protein